MIKLTHVYKTYQNTIHALRDVSLDLKKGELAFITGHSGAGKTTLFRLIAGFDKPSSGKIHVSNFLLNEINIKNLPYYRQKIGVVFQDYKLLNNYTVEENIAIPLLILQNNKQYIAKEVDKMLSLVGLSLKRKDYPFQLSGGEQQRIAIARALIHKPEILIADEPTGNLDPDLSQEIIQLFYKANAQGTTVLIATHNLELLKQVSYKHLYLKKGSLFVNG